MNRLARVFSHGSVEPGLADVGCGSGGCGGFGGAEWRGTQEVRKGKGAWEMRRGKEHKRRGEERNGVVVASSAVWRSGGGR